MTVTEFLLKLATDEDFYRQFSETDDYARYDLLREFGLSDKDQRLLSDRDLTGLKVKVRAEFDLEGDEACAIWTIYAVPGTIYIPPPPPPTEAS